MAKEITIPRLGWSMEEGTFREWLKPSGATIAVGEMLFVLEGEKAAQEIEAIDAGILWISPDAPQADDIVKVGQVIGYLLAVGEAPPQRADVTPAAAAAPAPVATVMRDNVKPSGPIATPRARRRARELAIDWTAIPGSGRGGRIRERDVIAFAGPATAAQRIRQSIAQRMLAGVQQAAPVTLTTKTDATELVRWRNAAKASGGIVPGYTEILVKLVAAVLPECPHLNACWENDRVRVHDSIHVAVAIDTESGLLAPVLANADQRSLDDLTRDFRELVQGARTGTLLQSQLQGGTFTVSNLGAFDIDFFTPILNLPQAAILGIGRIAREPVVRGDAIVISETIALSLTFDHRVIDGAPAARWLQRLGAAIRAPAAILDRA